MVVMSTFRLVPGRSSARFEARSSLHGIYARSDHLSGFLRAFLRADGSLDSESGVEGHIEIPVDSLVSGNSLYDRELRRRMDTARYPAITGDIHLVRSSPSSPNRFQVEGNITVKGETREASGEIEITRDESGALCLSGSQRFDIRDFNIEPPRLTMLRVLPEIVVAVELYYEEETCTN